jgi:hypothetical protein
MKEGKIILPLFLPTNEESARTIDPGMRSLRYPAPGTIIRCKDFLLLLCSTTANMRNVAAGLNLISRWCSIVIARPEPLEKLRLHH